MKKQLFELKNKTKEFIRRGGWKVVFSTASLAIMSLVLAFVLLEVLDLSSKKSVETQAVVTSASLYFVPEGFNISTGDEFMVNVFLDPGSETVSAVDARVIYDPNFLEYVSYSSEYADIGFPYYPVEGLETDYGLITISAVNFDPSTNPPQFAPGITSNDAGILGTLVFRALVPGSTRLAFDYTSGASDDSNVMKEGVVEDVLGEPVAVAVVIVDEVTPTPELSPTPTAVPEASCVNCFKGKCDGYCDTKKEGELCLDCQSDITPTPTLIPDPACSDCFKGMCDSRCHPKEAGTLCPDCL